MIFRAVLLVALGALSSCTCEPAMERWGNKYGVYKHPFSIDALPNGWLLPSHWNPATDRTRFTDRGEVDFTYQRLDQPSILSFGWDRLPDEQPNTIPDIAYRMLRSLLSSKLNTTFAVEQKLTPMVIHGADAMATLFSFSQDQKPIARFYLAVIKPPHYQFAFSVLLACPPDEFDENLDDAKAFASRVRLDLNRGIVSTPP